MSAATTLATAGYLNRVGNGGFGQEQSFWSKSSNGTSWSGAAQQLSDPIAGMR